MGYVGYVMGYVVSGPPIIGEAVGRCRSAAAVVGDAVVGAAVVGGAAVGGAVDGGTVARTLR